MSKSKNYVLSIEAYDGQTDEIGEYLSEKVCRYTIKIRKKIIRKTKRDGSSRFVNQRSTKLRLC